MPPEKKNGVVKSFTSFCGGLPSPQYNNNPFGYKFSWSPRGVLQASRNSAHFLQNGIEVEIPGSVLFDNFEVHDVQGLGKFEVYPNRDSTSYVKLYGINETQTMIRGTYRNLGWCHIVKKLVDLGFLDTEKRDLSNKTYAQVCCELAKKQGNPKTVVAEFLGLKEDDKIISAMEWVGLFENKEIPPGNDTFLDALCKLFLEKLIYEPGEVDMLLMQHKFEIEYKDKVEYRTTTLIDYGIDNIHSSMARTVGLPVAIAIRYVLEGKITLTGVQIPINEKLYKPILKELQNLGIEFKDKLEYTESTELYHSKKFLQICLESASSKFCKNFDSVWNSAKNYLTSNATVSNGKSPHDYFNSIYSTIQAKHGQLVFESAFENDVDDDLILISIRTKFLDQFQNWIFKFDDNDKIEEILI